MSGSHSGVSDSPLLFEVLLFQPAVKSLVSLQQLPKGTYFLENVI